MRSKDQILLEEAYEKIVTESSIRLELLESGYTKEQIDYLMEKGFMNKIKSFGLPAALAASMLTGQPQAKADDFLQNKHTQITQATDNARSSINVNRDLLRIANLAGQNKLNTDVLKKLREEAKQILGAKSNIELDQKLNQYNGTAYSYLNFLTTSFLGESHISQIIKERWENVNDPNYICVNQDNGEYLTFSDFDEAKNACDQFNSDDNTKDWVVKYDGDVVYPKEGYVESFVHGIQPISEAKKKVNPWAIEKSIEKKTGKKFGKKHKEEIIKGIKKSAKKSGKKITSDKVKPKKK